MNIPNYSAAQGRQGLVKVKVSSYIAQYPVLRTAENSFTLYFPSRPVPPNTVSNSL